MKITVTHADIANGEPFNSYRCPIALAIKRALNLKENEIRVLGPFALIGKDAHLLKGPTINLPREASDFAYAFDDNRDVRPFEFPIDYQPEPQQKGQNNEHKRHA